MYSWWFLSQWMICMIWEARLNLYIKLSLITRHAEIIRADVLSDLKHAMSRRKRKAIVPHSSSFSMCKHTLPLHHGWTNTRVLCNTVVLISHSYMWRFRHFSPEILNKRQVMFDSCCVHSLSGFPHTLMRFCALQDLSVALTESSWCNIWVWFVPVELVETPGLFTPAHFMCVLWWDSHRIGKRPADLNLFTLITSGCGLRLLPDETGQV